eukprot:1184330-Prorocentrum_minimum.AAC.1
MAQRPRRPQQQMMYCTAQHPQPLMYAQMNGHMHLPPGMMPPQGGPGGPPPGNYPPPPKGGMYPMPMHPQPGFPQPMMPQQQVRVRQSYAGSEGIFSQRTNDTQNARVYSHNEKIVRRNRGYILVTNQSYAGSEGIFS